MNVLYFAWVRQRVGKSRETVEPPGDVATVADLIGWLKTRGDEYEAAFSDLKVIRAAVDQDHAEMTQLIAGAREVAFFPPVTGG